MNRIFTVLIYTHGNNKTESPYSRFISLKYEEHLYPLDTRLVRFTRRFPALIPSVALN